MTYLFRLLIGESLGEPAYHNNALYKLYAINLASLMKHDDIWIFAVKTNYILLYRTQVVVAVVSGNLSARSDSE